MEIIMNKLPRKIIYFDETSAVDLLQIRQKGKLSRTIETIKEFSGGVGAEAKVDASLNHDGGAMNIIKKVVGFQGGFGAEFGLDGSFDGNRIAKTVIANSLLYDFLTAVESRRGNPLLEICEGYTLSIPKDSMTYFATIAPFTEMMEGNQKLENPDITMAVSKMNTGIRGSKGYYELIGESNQDKKIFRFNIDTFKNNYRIQDLPKMDLALYAIQVGKTKLSHLNFETEFNINNGSSGLEFTAVASDNLEKVKEEKSVDVYDVFIAGVK